MKVREIVEVAKWVDGSGWSYETTFSDDIKEIGYDTEEELRKSVPDWSWWEKSEPAEGIDYQITVKYYRTDYDPMFDDDEPIAEFKTWESEI